MNRDEIASTYSAAADSFDAPPLSFWDRTGLRTVQRTGLAPGEMVLDVCCGTGASAIPAAAAVAPTGRVIGVDLAAPLLSLARQKALAQSLKNVEFRQADFDQVYFRPDSFHAVLCVFGLFFFPDMGASLRKMSRFVRPGGKLAVTVWGKGALEPLHETFWDAIRRVRPDLDKKVHTRDKLSDPAALRALFTGLFAGPVEIEEEVTSQEITSPEDWWTVAMGSAYRGAIDLLTPGERDQVRAACLGLGSGTLRTPVIYALAAKP
jgi:ubiquinone/menaquinone biosynthesis C-methylase UbiE